jgi:predicted ATPase/signal transduction histidine kinase
MLIPQSPVALLSFPGYQVREQLFESRRSLVYRAIREADGASVILKVQAQAYASPAKVAALKREYEVLRGLDVPGVVRAWALESHQGRLVLVLEDFGGESLAQWSRRKPRDAREVVEVALRIVEALGQVHRRHVMHKDINPSNVVLDAERGVLKLIDLGISTVLSRESVPLRNPNVIEGTLAYISPEQTGRMNRAIDYRTDFYSLGATLYELLTGAQPFETKDPVEMVHAHIARHPVPAHERAPRVPKVLSAIVGKLMAKDAEDRYQSAHGIAADLQECLRRLDAGEELEHLPLGREDVMDRFHVPQRLYGRHEERDALLVAFGRVAHGATELMLVSGDAGIGKSAVVREIYKPITAQRGYFLSGKFDQFHGNVPFTSLVQAFQSLARQLLTESEAEVAAWKERLLAALGTNGQVIIDVIPEVQLIIGPQPAVPALAPREAQNRFHHVFQSFIRVFATREHPLVLFLDDLQWADDASLGMLQVLMTAGGGHLLVIGAYRDGEVGPAHLLTATLEAIRKEGGTVGRVHLGPLSRESVTHLLADAVHCLPGEVGELAELALAKTGGNPFFLGEFLKSLHTEGLIDFDARQRRFRWDLKRIAERGVTDNVVELMASKVRKLAEPTQRVLELAACIGNQFDLATLATVSAQSQHEAATALWEAIVAGLVVPQGEDYRLMTQDVQGLAEALPVEFRFAHDRVQQAAYSLIPEERRRAVHLRIGQLLLASTPEAEREARVFDLVHHLLLGRQCIDTEAERVALARLCLLAGRKAKASTAYRRALEYLTLGIELLGSEGWERHHELALALHVEATEVALLCTDFVEMERLAALVLARGRSLLEKAEVHDVRLQALIAQNKSRESVEMGLSVLAELGVQVPFSPAPADVQRAMEEAMAALAGREIEQLIDLPEMKDPLRLFEVRLYNRVAPPAYRVVPALYPLMMGKAITVLLKHGNNPEAPFLYALYGLLLCAFGQIETGYRFGQLALKLLERYPSKHIEARTRYIVTAFIEHWKAPMHEGLAPLAQAHRTGVATGDFEFAGFSALMYVCFGYFTGANLGELVRESSGYVRAIDELKQQTPLTYTRIHHQALLNLTGEAADPCRLRGEVYDEEAMKPVHLAANDLISLAYAALNRLMLCCTFEDFQRGVVEADLAEESLMSLAAMPHVPLVSFYGSLARLAVAAGASNTEREALLAKVAASQETLKKYAEHAPSSQAHRWELVEAERARVLGDSAKALAGYQKAIQLAQAHRYVNDEALANLLLGRFWLAEGDEGAARLYMSRAHRQYRQWGATAKVRQLEARYLRILWPGRKSTSVTAESVTTISSSLVLDLRTVIKASQTLSGQIVLSDLLEQMMSIAIESAGARRGTLMLMQQGRLVIEAEGSIGQVGMSISQGQEQEPSADKLAMSVIHYVARTGEPVVLNNASQEGAFTRDPYIRSTEARSILGMPVVHQGKLLGLLYLENNLVDGAFSADRVEVLGLLCTQTAISLENVRVYRTLEDKVEERTRELKQKTRELETALQQLQTMQEQIIVREKMASLGAMAAGIAHEVRNPLNFIINFAKLSEDLITELREEAPQLPEPAKAVVEDLGQNIRRIHEHGDRAGRIVNSMLAHSGTSRGEQEATDLHALMDQVTELVHYGLRSQQPPVEVNVVKEYDPSLGQVKLVPQEISRVLLNIMNNACDSLQEKQRQAGGGFSPKLTLTTRRVERGVEVRIRDNGKGLSNTLRDRIFEPFFTTKPAGKGVGLGLSLCYDIVVKKHRGTLSVESQEGEYADFVLTLPS